MLEEKKNENRESTDETGYINTEELRDVLKEEEKQKKQCWFKRLFSKKKNNKNKN